MYVYCLLNIAFGPKDSPLSTALFEGMHWNAESELGPLKHISMAII